MAGTTISHGGRMGRYRRRFGRRVDTGAIVMAGFARLHHGINQAVVENTAGQFERHDAVADVAIEYRVRQWVSNRMTLGRTRAVCNVTGITVRTGYDGAGVIGISIQETDRGVAVTAF